MVPTKKPHSCAMIIAFGEVHAADAGRVAAHFPDILFFEADRFTVPGREEDLVLAGSDLAGHELIRYYVVPTITLPGTLDANFDDDSAGYD